MKFEGIKGVFKSLSNSASKNSPSILTAVAVAGVISTTVLAVKATPKALAILDEERGDPRFGDDLTKTEIIKATWKCYIPAAIMGGVTIGCIIGANTVNLKRNAAIASLYSITDATLKEYQAKVIETIGENKERVIRDEVVKEKVLRDPVENKEVIITGKGEMLCYDAMSGRYFKSDIEKLRQIRNELNKELIDSMWVSLNDMYYEMGLKAISLGDEMGWNVDNLIEFDFSSQICEDGTPCIVVDYKVEPRYDYRKLK